MKAEIVSANRDDKPEPRVVLTPEQLRARNRRNVAIAVTVAFLVLLFYVVTIAKLGPAVLHRPL